VLCCVNPLPPSDAVKGQKENILEDLFCSVLSKIEKYHPSVNLKFNNLGIFKSLKLRNFMGEILQISHKLNFSPNTLDRCFGLMFSSVWQRNTNIDVGNSTF